MHTYYGCDVCVGKLGEVGNHRSHYKCIIGIINNMKDEYIEIRKTKKMGRGIFAKQNIQPGTLIMIVYKQNFITYERVKQQSIFWQIEQQIGCKLSCFAYFLCFCQNMKQNLKQPQIQEYINQLPQYFHNLICWTQQQLHLIQNQTLIRTVKQKRFQYIQKYQQIRSLIQQNQAKKIEVEEGDSSGSSKRSTRIVSHQMKRQKEGVQDKKMHAVKETTLKQFFKFIAVIKSRNIYWANEEDKRSEVGALIPYLQLFNHSPKSQCKVQPNCAGEKVITIKEIHKDEEVFVKYAQNLSVESCLLDYGMMDLTIEEYHGSLPNPKEQLSKIHSQRVQLAIRYNRYRQKLN